MRIKIEIDSTTFQTNDLELAKQILNMFEQPKEAEITTSLPTSTPAKQTRKGIVNNEL